MSNFEFKRDDKGVADLMNSPEMAAILLEKANQVQAIAGNGYEVELRRGTRQRALVHAGIAEAYYDNIEHNTLIKALGAAK